MEIGQLKFNFGHVHFSTHKIDLQEIFKMEKFIWHDAYFTSRVLECFESAFAQQYEKYIFFL